MSAPPILIELELVRAKEAEDAFAFRFARQNYLVRSAQGAYQTVELPWSRELLRDLEEIRDPDRDPATVARVGELLRELLDPAGWGAHEATIVEARASRRRVHLTIRSAAAELYALPWELLTLRADGQHLGALDHVLLRYAWPGTSTVAADPEASQTAGRMLLAWSAAGGGVPAAEQTKAIRAAAEAADYRGLEVLANASYGAIADALEEGEREGRPFGVLHLLCHGAEAGSTFGLSLDDEGEEGRPTVVDAGRLQQLVAPHAHALRLVVVSACDGGNMGEPGNRIGSVAQRLHRAGIQYVLASRYPLSARGSTRMSAAFYEALLGGTSVEQAFVLGRAAASREVTQLDWASLQLYARPEDDEPAVAPILTEIAASSAKPAGRSLARWLLIGALAAVVAVGLFFALRGSGEDRPEPPAEPRAPEPAVPPPSTSGASGIATGDTAGGSITGAETEAGTTASVADEPDPETPRVRPKPPTKPTITKGRPTRRCGSALRDHINDRMGPPSRGRYRVEIWAREDGSVRLGSCSECGDLSAEARTALRRIKASTLTTQWKDELPCRVTFDWQ